MQPVADAVRMQAHYIVAEAGSVDFRAGNTSIPLPLGPPPRQHLRGLPAALPRLRRRDAHPRLHHRRRARRRHPPPPLGLPATPPPLSPARGPPQHDLGFDADPGFDIDQTHAPPDRAGARRGLRLRLRSEPRRLRPCRVRKGASAPLPRAPLQILDAQTAGVATLPTHLDIASSGTANGDIIHVALDRTRQRINLCRNDEKGV